MRFKGHTAVLAAELIGIIVATAAFGVQQPGADETGALFQRVRARMAAHLAQLKNYTCHETIDRVVRTSREFRHLDTIELEVAFVHNQQLFSRTGEGRFGEQTVDGLVGGGTISDGALGANIDLIFSRDLAELEYAGECKKDGRKALRVNLRVPTEKSTILIRHNGRSGVGGYDGSVWVDAETLDPIRVDYKVNRIPAYLGVRLIEESMHYKKLTIGNSQFYLPVRSELGATDDTGTYSLNMMKLSACREFGADSEVKYGPPSQGSAARERQDH